MPYNPMMAMTNAQMRDQKMRGALQDFMGYFQSLKAQKDDAEKRGMLSSINDSSRQLSDATANAAPVQGAGALNQKVQALQSQIPGASNPVPQPLGAGVAGPLPAGPTFSPLNPAINPDAVKAGAAQEPDLNSQVAAKARGAAQAKASYLNKYGPEGSAFTADDMMTEDALKKEKLAQAKGATQSQDLGNQLNAGLLSSRIQSAQSTAGKDALDLSTAQQTQPTDILAKKLEPALSQGKIGLMGAQANEANATAAMGGKIGMMGKINDDKQIASAERQAKALFQGAGKETGYETVKNNWDNIQSAIQQANDPKIKDKVATDYTILDQYLKMVNPGMGVRSSNMEMFANSMGLSDKIKSGMLKVQQGGKFDPQVRDAISEMAKGIFANHEKAYMDKLRSIDEGIQATPGADRERVFGKTMAARISGAGQPVGGLGQDDLDLINKYKPKAANAGQ